MDKDNVIVPTNVTEFSQYKAVEGSSEGLSESDNYSIDSTSIAMGSCTSVSSSSSPSSDPVKKNKEIDPIMQQEFEDALNSNRDNEKKSIPSIGWREIKALKRSRYLDVKDKYDKAFILSNKRTKQVVEIQAASSLQACQMIGWKPRHIKVLDVLNVKDRDKKIEAMINNTNIETSVSSEKDSIIEN